MTMVSRIRDQVRWTAADVDPDEVVYNVAATIFDLQMAAHRRALKKFVEEQTRVSAPLLPGASAETTGGEDT